MQDENIHRDTSQHSVLNNTTINTTDTLDAESIDKRLPTSDTPNTNITQTTDVTQTTNVIQTTDVLDTLHNTVDIDFNILNNQPVVNIGVLGHVAHGKSTLVKQITGIKTQKYSTEQKSGRTVKLGYANVKIFQCDNCHKYITRPSNTMGTPICDNILCNVGFQNNGRGCILVNHISFVDCFSPDTKVLCHNGKEDIVSNLKVGDKLMGPDGTVRNILKVWSGQKVMYDINYNGVNFFTCTGGHPLVLRIDNSISEIRKHPSREEYEYTYFRQIPGHNIPIGVKIFNTQNEDIQVDRNLMIKTMGCKQLVFEITVEEYLKWEFRDLCHLFYSDKLGNGTSQPFVIKEAGHGDYIGFTTDGDQRFLLSNFLVVHNCPGHEILMTTMLNGTAVMDAAMLVIAANEQVPQLQTQEHLVAAEIMGLTNILLVQNKVDLVSKDDAVANAEAITNWVLGTCAEGSPIIPISAQFGYGVQRVIESLAKLKPANRGLDKPPVFACVRSFDINKPGATVNDLVGGVIGGTLLQGKLNVNDRIEIRPGVKCLDNEGRDVYVPFVTEITSIRSEENMLKQVIPGGLIAIGTNLDPYFTTKDSLVGCIMGRQLPQLEKEIVIQYFMLRDSTVKQLKKGDEIRITALSRTVMATVIEKLEKPKRTVRVQLSEPLCLIEGYSKFSISIQSNNQWRLVGVALVKFEGDTHVEHIVSGSTAKDFGRFLPKYSDLFEPISGYCTQKAKVTKLNLDPPHCERQGGARTVWTNFGKIVEQLCRPMEHLRRFVSNELAAETSITQHNALLGPVMSNNQLVLFGKYTGANFESILRSYIKQYCKCSNCSNFSTLLQQDANTDIVVCSFCGRNNMVSSTSQVIPKKGKGGKIKKI